MLKHMHHDIYIWMEYSTLKFKENMQLVREEALYFTSPFHTSTFYPRVYFSFILGAQRAAGGGGEEAFTTEENGR